MCPRGLDIGGTKIWQLAVPASGAMATMVPSENLGLVGRHVQRQLANSRQGYLAFLMPKHKKAETFKIWYGLQGLVVGTGLYEA